MAVSATVVNRQGGPIQFPLLFSDAWMVTVTVDPANVATQVTGTDTVTVTGVALGDFVLCFEDTTSQGNMTITAYISAANTVTILYSNNTAGGIDLATGTVKMLVLRPAW